MAALKITHEQLRDDVKKGLSNTELATKYGVNSRTIARRKAKLKSSGFDPVNDREYENPEDQLVKGYSTLVRHKSKDDSSTGKLIEWVKTDVDKERIAQMQRAALDAMCEEVPRLPAIDSTNVHDSDLANFYTITDYHVGMMALAAESGVDWGIKKSEEVLTGAFSSMIARSPDAELGVINQQGDFAHFDGIKAITPGHGHLLDTDTRFYNLVHVAIRALRALIDMALYKHKKVHVIIAEGNHDISSVHWLQMVIYTAYENDPRVYVEISPAPYYVLQHGKTMIGVTHGHLKHGDALPLLFASMFPKVWGATTKRYSHEGHRHHKQIKELSGMIREMHQTLAPNDAHSARGGYFSERAANCITYHKIYGEVGRVEVKPEMLQLKNR